jgi:hypothetical protein
LFEPIDKHAHTILCLEDLPDLDLLLSLTMGEWHLHSVFKEAARILDEKGIPFTPVMTTALQSGRDGLNIIRLCDTRERNCAFHFRITQRKRRALVASLQLSQDIFPCECPHTLAQYKLLNREGAWQAALSVNPVLDLADTLNRQTGDNEE